MKKIILLTVLLSVVANTFSQDTTRQAYSKEYYLRKSKNQKTAAWVLVGMGTAMTIAGFIVTLNEADNYIGYYGTLGIEGSPPSDDAAVFLIITGVAADIISIPFFISAGKNKKHAAEVAFGIQKTYLPQKNAVALMQEPGISIRIGF